MTSVDDFAGWDFFNGSNSFRYPINQPYGYFSGKMLKLKEVVEMIDKGELNRDNALTIDQWVDIVPKVKPGSYDFDEVFGDEDKKDRKSFPVAYTSDFPAFGIVAHQDGRIFVGVKGVDSNGVPSIGALDHKKFLAKGVKDFAPGLKAPLRLDSDSQKLHEPHPPSRTEKYCRYLKNITLDEKTGLFVKPNYLPFKPDFYSTNVPRVWEAQKDIDILVIGHPIMVIGGGGDRWISLNSLARDWCGKSGLGLIKIEYK